MVRAASPRLSVARDERSLRCPRLRGHAPADPGRPCRAGVRTVPRPVPDRCGACARVASRRGARLGGARVQPPSRGSFGSRTCDRRDHGGRVPADPDELKRLPGVGPYTAAAIASLAYGATIAAVDTNVRRVVARARLGREPGEVRRDTIDDEAGRWLD